MNRFRVITVAACIGLTAAMIAPSVRADEWNRKSVVTFSQPVEIPGAHRAGWGILPPGTYVFRILESQSDRHIVQIFDKEETTIYATILAIPNYRLKATDKTVITFSERPAGEPEALRAWFYPGRNWGEEFVYPKAKAVALAQAAKAPVLFTTADLPIEITEPVKSASEPLALELTKVPVMAVMPTGEEAPLAAAVTPPPALAEVAAADRPVPAPTPARPLPDTASALPDTASGLPLVGLFGIVAMGGALVVRAVGRSLR